MEADFSKQITEFFAGRKKESPINYTDLRDKLNVILEKVSGDLPLSYAQSVYRRGSASFDHIHFPGASRMQLGIARVLRCADLDKDLREGEPSFYNERAEDAVIDYDGAMLALAKVKLTEEGIDYKLHNLHVAIDDDDWQFLFRPFKTAEGYAVYTKDRKGSTIKIEFNPQESSATVCLNESWTPSFWVSQTLSLPTITEEEIEKIRNLEV